MHQQGFKAFLGGYMLAVQGSSCCEMPPFPEVL